jgi:hypothetical protein
MDAPSAVTASGFSAPEPTAQAPRREGASALILARACGVSTDAFFVAVEGSDMRDDINLIGCTEVDFILGMPPLAKEHGSSPSLWVWEGFTTNHGRPVRGLPCDLAYEGTWRLATPDDMVRFDVRMAEAPR